MAAEYRISTLADFLAVPEDKIDVCLADFKTWLGMARDPSGLTQMVDNLTGTPGAARFLTDGFTWVDDGIAGLTALDITDPEGSMRIRIAATAD